MDSGKLGKFKRTNKVKFGFLILSLITTLFIIFIFMDDKNVINNVNYASRIDDVDADMILRDIEQISTRQGLKEWRLFAELAKLEEEKQRMTLEKPVVDFFLKDGSTLNLEADHGKLEINTKNINVNGHVIAQNMNYRLLAEELGYQHQKKLLQSNKTVKITGKSFELKADSMEIDLNANEIIFKGNVEGFINEKIPL